MTVAGTSLAVQAPQADFFAGIPDHDQKLILGVAEQRRFSPKGMIVHSGDAALCLFLVRKGNIKYYRVTDQGEEVLLWWLSPGDIFGMSAFLPNPLGYIGSAEAASDCTLWAWDHATIRNLSTVYRQLSENALRITLGYLAAYVDRHTRMSTRTARQRLAYTLLQLGHRSGQTHPAGVDIDITNEQLGGLADVGSFTVSRLLGRWERQGTIAKGRGRVRINAPEKLLTI